jgi:hypothetical protein
VENNGFTRIIPCVRSANVIVGLFVVVIGIVVGTGTDTLPSGSISSSEAN